MTITASERTDLIKVAVGLFNAAPGSVYLSGFVPFAGNTDGLISALVADPAFTAIYPTYLTSAEFAGNFVDSLIGSATVGGDDPTATVQNVKDWIAGRLDAGESRASVLSDVLAQLDAAAGDDAVWGEVATQFDNKVKVAEYYSVDQNGNATSLTTLKSVVSSVTASTDVSTPEALAAAVAGSGAGVNVGQTFALTTDAEAKTGTSANDTFNGSDKTLVLDVLDGSTGSDTLNYSDSTGAKDLNGLGLTLTSIETINVRSVAAAKADTTGFSGVDSLNILLGGDTTVKAGTSTDVKVSGVTGAIGIDGGKNVTVTDSTAGKDITIGATTVNAGNVTVTDTNVGAADVKVDGGKAVTLTLAGSTGAGKVITVGNGGAASDLPSGAVVVASAQTAAAGTDVTLNAITVKGGSTVTVTQTADTSKAATDTTGATLTQGDVTVVGGGSTTTVTVAQAASTTEVAAVNAVAGVTETASVKFSALTAGQTLIIGGLTFTASVAMTASEAAATFANLVKGSVPVAGDSQAGGAASKGTYTGTFTGWTSAAANGDTVVFTSTTANTDVGNLANTGTGSVVVTTTAGSPATTAKTGVLGVANGTVTIDDAAAASITTVSVDGYGNASTIGNTATLSKLSNLTLANSGSTGTAGETDATLTVDAAGVATLNVTVNNIKGAVSLDGAADNALKTLNLTASGADSSFALTAAAVETLAVSGSKAVSLTADLAAVKTVTVSGSAGLTLSGLEDNTLTSVDTSATTGKVIATIDGTKATYTGGAGVDVVTLSTGTALTKAINLGAGDDTVVFSAAVTGSTAALNGGDGTDTLSMTVANADTLDAAKQTFYTGFEHLTLNNIFGTADGVADALTLDLDNLGFTSYVTTSGTQVTGVGGATATDVLTLNNLVSGGTVVLTAQGSITVGVKDAATGTADVLNAVLSSSVNLTAGTLTAANVETVNISTVDTEVVVAPAVQTKNVDSLTLTADKATTVNLTGGQDLNLTLTGSTKVTTIDGSALTGGLTVTSLNTTSATTIKGGAGNDVLTAATGSTADVLLGGAGDDTLTANAGLNTLTGGAGNDLFVINTASLNVNSYATVTDFGAGDLLKLNGANSFASAKVSLGDTAVFQDYANAAINNTNTNDVSWFQFGGNTYVIENLSNGSSFANGTDYIVKLSGLVDLTNASFNNTHDTISL